ncbi:Phosphoenolpyruvate/pyruvate domain-containing protein [Sodiomyces alkalinus F11]|uniref:Phosphoenolpyruvate/pyruvate domain-containing protein n=1 Tax=Sodiomyces alkalinus (strain CBS 110278 / VKM F-3762 / F11) TaxID=1314773 RepID=A0A3N2PUY8_SODAK|nr:Phosphoenolpyruvate/pyruvate domain-containing protein [Sodiomyces alkalinus F11]ROT38300.1 Phosphoenolpyruvate/pyruvate domain-containing protein [Sodiomyces alkalinus F11]
MATFASASPSAPLLGSYLMLSSTLLAYTLGGAGFDWVLIDMEHSPLSPADATALVHAVSVASRNKTVTFVRTPSSGVEYVKWALDSGANGIVVPMIQSREQAEAVVSHARYPPAGQRSFGPFYAPYANLAGDGTLTGYAAETAKDVSVILMIESAAGVENAEGIMSTPGISGIFVGPVDLRLSLGLSGPHGEEAAYLQALGKIAQLGQQLGVKVGIFVAQPDVMPRLQRLGYSYFLVGGDVMFAGNGARAALTAAKDVLRDSKI